MGKGDKKSKKGKISIGSYGNSRRKRSTVSADKIIMAKAAKKETVAAEGSSVDKKAAPAKKAPAKKTDE